MNVVSVVDMGYSYAVWFDTGTGFMQRKEQAAGEKTLEVYEEAICALCAKLVDTVFIVANG